MVEVDPWHKGELWPQCIGRFTMMLQQFTAFRGVGALLNHIPILELQFLCASWPRWEVSRGGQGVFHQACNIIEGQCLTCLRILIRIHLKRITKSM